MTSDRKLLILTPVILLFLAGSIFLLRRPSPSKEQPPPPSLPPPVKPPEPGVIRKSHKPASPAEPKHNQTSAVKLLEVLVLKEDAVRGEWVLAEGRLVTPAIKFGTLQFPCVPPNNYDLECVISRVSNNDSLVLGLVYQGKQCQVVLDGNNGSASWLWVNEGKKGLSDDGVSYFQGPVLRSDRAVSVFASVRKDRLTVKVDDFIILDWRGSSDKLSLMQHWGVPDLRTLFIGSWQSAFSIEKVVVTPVQGAVGLLR